jgi:hypothetical protein
MVCQVSAVCHASSATGPPSSPVAAQTVTVVQGHRLIALDPDRHVHRDSIGGRVWHDIKIVNDTTRASNLLKFAHGPAPRDEVTLWGCSCRWTLDVAA